MQGQMLPEGNFSVTLRQSGRFILFPSYPSGGLSKIMQSQRFRLLMGIALTTIAAIAFTGCSSGDGSPDLGVNNNAFTTVDRVTNSEGFYSPSSAVPDAAEQFIYFVASDDKGRGVFKVPATGGAATEVFVGP